ncbi:hypothetical protein BB170200_02380 [Mycobacterium marinum]|nr:hypothetical protein BB170200_02380 [Mycobacterium marinum]
MVALVQVTKHGDDRGEGRHMGLGDGVVSEAVSFPIRAQLPRYLLNCTDEKRWGLQDFVGG